MHLSSLFQYAWTMQRGVQSKRASRSLQARFMLGPNFLKNGAPASTGAQFSENERNIRIIDFQLRPRRPKSAQMSRLGPPGGPREAPKRPPGGPQEAPRRPPGGPQEAPGRPPGSSRRLPEGPSGA